MRRIDNTIYPMEGGHIRLVDSMGSDSAIVQAARVSYGKGTKTVSEDSTLIRYLMRHWHTTPFEMCEVKFHIRCPMDLWRQWIRHRTASVNEYSTRYSEAIDEKATTSTDEWRAQSGSNKQGSGEYLDSSIGCYLSSSEKALHTLSRDIYQDRLIRGVAREQARKDLPLSTFTEAYWKCDLHNIFHFLRLRMDSHAQLEIRQYANAMSVFIDELYPIAYQAFVDYRLNALSFSGPEVEALRAFIRADEYGLEDVGANLSKRELGEFEAKLQSIDSAFSLK